MEDVKHVEQLGGENFHGVEGRTDPPEKPQLPVRDKALVALGAIALGIPVAAGALVASHYGLLHLRALHSLTSLETWGAATGPAMAAEMGAALIAAYILNRTLGTKRRKQAHARFWADWADKEIRRLCETEQKNRQHRIAEMLLVVPPPVWKEVYSRIKSMFTEGGNELLKEIESAYRPTVREIMNAILDSDWSRRRKLAVMNVLTQQLADFQGPVAIELGLGPMEIYVGEAQKLVDKLTDRQVSAKDKDKVKLDNRVRADAFRKGLPKHQVADEARKVIELAIFNWGWPHRL